MQQSAWVLATRDVETEGVVTIAEIAARLLGRETAEEDDGEPDSNNVKSLPVTLEEAKRSSLCLSEFVGDNIALLSEEGYRILLQIPDSYTRDAKNLNLCVVFTVYHKSLYSFADN